MTLFNSLSISGTGVDAMQTWIDAAGSNIANANDAVATNQPTYAPQTAIFTPVSASVPGQPGEGVAVSVSQGSTTGIVAHEPNSPLADKSGNVRLPNVSLADQLVGLIQAQENYTANTDAMSRAVAAYQSGLTIGS